MSYDRGYGPHDGWEYRMRDGGREGEGFGARRACRNEGRPEDYRPRYSPVGGTWGPMGGSYLARRSPPDVEDVRWTSETTRWF